MAKVKKSVSKAKKKPEDLHIPISSEETAGQFGFSGNPAIAKRRSLRGAVSKRRSAADSRRTKPLTVKGIFGCLAFQILTGIIFTRRSAICARVSTGCAGW